MAIKEKILSLIRGLGNIDEVLTLEFQDKIQKYITIIQKLTDSEKEELDSIVIGDFRSFLSEEEPDDFEKIQKIFEEIKPLTSKSISESNNLVDEECSREKELEDNALRQYFFDCLKINVSEFSEDSLKIEKNNELLREARDYVRWNGDNLQEEFSKYMEIPLEKVFEITTLSEYVSKLAEITLEGEFFLSRGQKDCTFQLKPSLFRNNTYTENILIEKFTRGASFYDESILKKEKYSRIAYAQHHGLPTRLLDFTEAHLLSLFFSVEEYDYLDKPSVVYVVDTSQYHDNIINNRVAFLDFSTKENSEHYMQQYEGEALFIKLEDSNERIHFQKGYFLLCQEHYQRNIGDLRKNNCYAFLIRPENKKQIFDELFSIGINFESIYPDIDNLVRNIKYRK